MKKILIIEDEKKIRRFLQLELEHEGYSVATAENGADGLEKFKKDYFDLILLDLMMPKMSGEEVCRAVRNISQVPIIVLTAKDQTLNKVELLDMGADDYLTKPFEIEELFARMRVALRNKKDFENTGFIIYHSLKLDINSKKLYKNEKEIYLTKKNLIFFICFFLIKKLSYQEKKFWQMYGGLILRERKKLLMYI